jgi:hypothetical protein
MIDPSFRTRMTSSTSPSISSSISTNSMSLSPSASGLLPSEDDIRSFPLIAASPVLESGDAFSLVTGRGAFLKSDMGPMGVGAGDAALPGAVMVMG